MAKQQSRDGDADPLHQIRRDIGLRLTVLTRLFRNDFDRRVAASKLTRSKWSLIAVVARRPGTNQRVIAEALEMSEVSVGRLIEKLCKEGLLERRPSAGDRRAFSIHLMPPAQPLLQQLAEIAREAEEQMFRDISMEQLVVVRAALDKMYDNVKALAEPARPCADD